MNWRCISFCHGSFAGAKRSQLMLIHRKSVLAGVLHLCIHQSLIEWFNTKMLFTAFSIRWNMVQTGSFTSNRRLLHDRNCHRSVAVTETNGRRSQSLKIIYFSCCNRKHLVRLCVAAGCPIRPPTEILYFIFHLRAVRTLVAVHLVATTNRIGVRLDRYAASGERCGDGRTWKKRKFSKSFFVRIFCTC